MILSQILMALSIGLAAGVSSGLFGIGGGVIIVPLLLYFFKYPQQMATATSLVTLMLPVGVLGAFQYYKAGFIQTENIKVALIIAAGMFVGALFGAKFASGLQSATLSKMFSVFLIIIAVRLWLTAK